MLSGSTPLPMGRDEGSGSRKSTMASGGCRNCFDTVSPASLLTMSGAAGRSDVNISGGIDLLRFHCAILLSCSSASMKVYRDDSCLEFDVAWAVRETIHNTSGEE